MQKILSYLIIPVSLVFLIGNSQPDAGQIPGDIRSPDQKIQVDWIYNIDTTFFWAKNADTMISIWRDTLSDSSNEFIHPGISFNPRKFGANAGDTVAGYDSTSGGTAVVIAKSGSPKKFLIGGFTPYPFGNGTYEDIYLRWSDNFQDWTIPYAIDSLTGHKIYVNDPIIRAKDIHPDAFHLADPDYAVDRKGQTWMLFTVVIDSAYTPGDRQKIMAVRALNDISWRPQDTLTIAEVQSANAVRQFISPSLVVDTIYRIYCIYKNPDSIPFRSLAYFWADSMEGTWHGPVICSLYNNNVWGYGGDATPWHIKVRHFGYRYLSMITPFTNEPFDYVNRGCLWMALSDDGENFTVAGRPVISPRDFKSDRFDGVRIYRSDFIPEWTTEGIALNILYSCHGTTDHWYTAYTKLHFNRRAYQKLKFESVNHSASKASSKKVRLDRYGEYSRIVWSDTIHAPIMWRDSCTSTDTVMQHDTISAWFEPEQWMNHLDSFVIFFRMPNASTPDSAAINSLYIMAPKARDNIEDSLIWRCDLDTCNTSRKFTRLSIPIDLDIDPDLPYSFHITTSLRSQRKGVVYCRSMYLIASEK
ncbi:MAG: hypothetical protein JSU69_08055 [Candidatus Zixiibacteriota bacterium]|nr:MAG: hypothetical protein JSU69_08055 [candidate division Zixibacteria bacterium]